MASGRRFIPSTPPNDTPALRVLSLGAGVQSSALAMMIAAGEVPPVDCAIFSDTGWEPKAVYEWLDWIEAHVPFPIHRVRKDDLDLRSAVLNRPARKHGFAVPFYHGESGRSPTRQCTVEWKIKPIIKKTRELLGVGYRQRVPKGTWVQMVVGISWDEIERMRNGLTPYILNDYPLIERRWTRQRCLEWFTAKGLPLPPRSSCLGCPFHSDDEWRRIRDQYPEEFAQTVEDDRVLNERWGHRMHKRGPLATIDLTKDDRQQELGIPGFVNECIGMCGV